jgi:hypothetical protein
MPTVQSILLSFFGIFFLQLLLRLGRVARYAGSVSHHHDPDTDHFMARRLTSELLLQQPLWSILPFEPTFYCGIHDWTDYPADSLYKYGTNVGVGAQKET